MRDVYLTIGLRASFTEVGTLELWCESRETSHRWRLQFELRGEEAQAQHSIRLNHRPSGTFCGSQTSDANVESAAQLIGNVFGGSAESPTGSRGTCQLRWKRRSARKGTRGRSRPFAGSVMAHRGCRGAQKVSRHEMRWLNLSGFCLRPGFGVPGDDARVNRLRTIASNDLAFVDDLQCQVAMLVLLRRIAGGINASEQQTLYRKHTSLPVARRSASTANSSTRSGAWLRALSTC